MGNRESTRPPACCWSIQRDDWPHCGVPCVCVASAELSSQALTVKSSSMTQSSALPHLPCGCTDHTNDTTPRLERQRPVSKDMSWVMQRAVYSYEDCVNGFQCLAIDSCMASAP